MQRAICLYMCCCLSVANILGSMCIMDSLEFEPTIEILDELTLEIPFD